MRRGTRALAVAFALAATLALLAPANAVESVQSGDAYAEVTATEAIIGNAAVERRWPLDTFRTSIITDKRSGAIREGPSSDLSLDLDGLSLDSGTMPIQDVELAEIAGGGVRVTFSLLAPRVLEVLRIVEVYPGIAGFRSRTRLYASVPVALSGYTLDRVPAPGALTTIHAFRAGADWRDATWSPRLSIGDAHTGDWRDSRTAASPGEPIAGPGEWISARDPASDGRAFLVMERRDYASSRLSYDGAAATAVVDLSRDVVYTGPFEEDLHAENPAAGPARHRVIIPGEPLELEPVFTGLGIDADDEPWQYFKALSRGLPSRREVTFNTNNVDDNVRSTGAKDDVDYDRFVSLAAAAREMGVDTFIFDDGWQGRSGDWCPDSAACPDPRWDGSASSMFRPRFPDPTFAAVREVLEGDPGSAGDDIALGLWLTPMEFHPRSDAYTHSPEWACAPVGDGTAAVSIAQPDDGSNEAGIGVWNPEALGTDPDGTPSRLVDYIEGRIIRAIEIYGARYFKFDFLVWIDCAGVRPVDAYGYHDSFLAMLDRLRAAHPEVTFQIDETNDYRLFPFESVARGPSWFQNGSPASPQLLHNLWSLTPWIPPFSIGQHVLGNAGDRSARGVDYLMAVALGSHITFWTEIDDNLTTAQRAQVRRWTDFYKANRATLATFTYPLLADPSAGGWTALQPWDADAGRGWLLAYRQQDASESATIPLRGVPAGRQFAATAHDPATGAVTALGVFTSEALRAGITIAAPAWGYRILSFVQVS